MQANELRIGNWVRSPYGDISQIEALLQRAAIVSNGGMFPYNQLKHVELSPEILEELGFEFDSDRNSFVYKVNNDYVEYYEAVSGNQLSLCCDKHNFYLPLDHITSLHQLQNFIYFTFNTELQWNRKQ